MSLELMERSISAIAEKDSSIRAVLRIDPAATRCARQLAGEESRSRLHGLPILIKDNIATAGVECSAGSRLLAGWRPQRDATVVDRLRRAGGIVLGKTNMDELAMGSASASGMHPPTRNPHDLERSPGGSSGGSAAAVAAGFCDLALGSDSGGSVRQPASWCGVAGLRPTQGRLSRRGLVAFCSSMDQIGLLGSDSSLLFAALEALSGRDPGDSKSADPPAIASAPPPGGWRVGLPIEVTAGCQPGVVAAFESALSRGRERLGEIVHVDIGDTAEQAVDTLAISSAEAATNFARFDAQRFGFRIAASDFRGSVLASRSQLSRQVQRRILFGTWLLSDPEGRRRLAAVRERRMRSQRAARELFEQVDLVLMPTTPTVAQEVAAISDRPAARLDTDRLCCWASLCGLPALSVPMGRAEDDLPCGLQLVAAPWHETWIAAAVEALDLEGRR